MMPHGVGVRRSWWQPWAALSGFAFLLHFLWEMAQTPFYAGMPGSRHWDAVLQCGWATAGDVVIVLCSYAAVAIATRQQYWLEKSWGWRLSAYLLIGLGVTILLEWLNVYLWGRWAYAPSMPTLLGVGVTPLVQWIALPPLNLWLALRHLGPAAPVAGS